MRQVAINSKHAQDELMANLNDHDLIKAHIVLDHFSRMEMGAQRRILYELNRRGDTLAVSLLAYLQITDPQTAELYPDIAESILDQVVNAPGMLLDLLARPGVTQGYFIELAGKLRLPATVPALIGLLARHSDSGLIQTTLQALGAIGSPEAVAAIAELASSGSEELLPAVISALGQIASPTALTCLLRMLGATRAMDEMIVDCLATMHDDAAITAINEIMRSEAVGLRNYAKGTLIGLGAKVVPVLVANLPENDADLQIHSLNALLAIGDERAVQPIRKLIASQPPDANVRFAAFEALAGLPVRKGDYIWASGLLDPEDTIRLAAARAIERGLDDLLAAGIRNMVKPGDHEAAQVVRAILDGQARHIFMNLIRHDIGLDLICTYLTVHAHPEVRKFFIQVLSEAGYGELAMSMESQQPSPSAPERVKVCAVDDSRMILSIYRSVLNSLGYDPELFAAPKAALLWLTTNRPRFVCTDLNMPGMNGIALTRAIRKLYTSQELPIIMITTQNDLRDQAEAYAAGVNHLAAKPFDQQSLQLAIQSVTSSGNQA
jgi:CheY-like chemotaxis protein/HEAT repeat protein